VPQLAVAALHARLTPHARARPLKVGGNVQTPPAVALEHVLCSDSHWLTVVTTYE
jgi:hypothetical protein